MRPQQKTCSVSSACVRLVAVAILWVCLLSILTPAASGQDYAIDCTVNTRSLNLRPGPGPQFNPPLTSLAKGTLLSATARNANSSWLQVSVVDSSQTGWVSAQFVDCVQAVSSLPAAASPAVPQSSRASAQPAAPPAASGPLIDFETWGTWRQGDETWGTMVQSSAEKHSGAHSAQMTYSFLATAGEKSYVVYEKKPPVLIPGEATALTMWVNGDGSGNSLNVWIQDANSQLWQFTFGPINHTGWQPMVAQLDQQLVRDGKWPNQAIGNPNATSIAYPIRFYALVLDGVDARDSSGTLYFDDLSAGSSPVAEPPAQSTAVPAAAAATPTPTSTPTQGPASIWFRADPETILPGQCTTLRWDVDNVKAVYFEGKGRTGHESASVCPATTTTYQLKVVTAQGEESPEVTVFVTPPTPTVTPAPPPRLCLYYNTTGDKWEKLFDSGDMEHYGNGKINLDYLTTGGEVGVPIVLENCGATLIELNRFSFEDYGDVSSAPFGVELTESDNPRSTTYSAINGARLALPGGAACYVETKLRPNNGPIWYAAFFVVTFNGGNRGATAILGKAEDPVETAPACSTDDEGQTICSDGGQGSRFSGGTNDLPACTTLLDLGSR
jgi:hypothetical protein